jgi:PAS domain S-box-containing protein
MKNHYLKQELYSLIKDDDTLFEFLQAGSLDGVWYWDLENPVHEWMSPRFWELLGYEPSSKKHMASEWQDLIFAEDLALAIDNFNQHCADADHPYDQVVRYRHQDGSTVWVRCRGVAIRDEAGNPVRMLGVHTDLTEQKRTEEELRQRNQELHLALEEIKTLRGIIPICSQCKKIRSSDGYWQQVEEYITSRTDAMFSHSICDDCGRDLYPDYYKNLDSKKKRD